MFGAMGLLYFGGDIIGGAALVDIGGVADGRSFIEVDLHGRAGLVGQDRPAAVVAATFLPFPYSPIRPGHIMDVPGVQAGFIISAIGEWVFTGLGLFEGQEHSVGQPDHPDALVVGQRITVAAVCFQIGRASCRERV